MNLVFQIYQKNIFDGFITVKESKTGEDGVIPFQGYPYYFKSKGGKSVTLSIYLFKKPAKEKSICMLYFFLINPFFLKITYPSFRSFRPIH